MPPGPDEGPPPRRVDATTRVYGHACVRDDGGAYCSCGWSSTAPDGRAAVAAHLRTAWPVLLPQWPLETGREWRDRLAASVEDAVAAGDDGRARVLERQLRQAAIARDRRPVRQR